MNRFISSNVLSSLNSWITTKIFHTLTFQLPPEVFIRRMKTSLLRPVIGTVSSRCAKKTVVRMTELVAALLTFMARCPSLRMWIVSLIHLLGLSGSLSITDVSAQFITWFSVFLVQCESKKIPPLRFSDNFFQTDGNFLINFYTPIVRSFLH